VALEQRYRQEDVAYRRLAQIKDSVEAETRAKTQQLREQLSQQKEEYNAKVGRERKRGVDNIELEKTALGKCEKELEEAKERYEEKIASMEGVHAQKLVELKKKTDELLAEKAETTASYEEQLGDVARREQNVLQQLEDEFEGQLNEEKHRQSFIQKKTMEEGALHIAVVAETEVAEEREYNKTMEEIIRVVVSEKAGAEEIKRAFTALQDLHNAFMVEHERLAELVRGLQREIIATSKTITERDDESVTLSKELRERRATIQQKELRLAEVKQKNQELEKFKYVLDYKITELNGELDPQRQTVAAQAQQLAEMEAELQTTQQKADDVRLKYVEKGLKIEVLNRHLAQAKHVLGDKDAYVRQFAEQLHRLFTSVSHTAFKSEFLNLYHTYVTKDANRKQQNADSDQVKELSRQRDFLEHNLSVMKTKASRGAERMKMDLQRRITENVHLVNEMNALRREYKESCDKIAQLREKLPSDRAARFAFSPKAKRGKGVAGISMPDGAATSLMGFERNQLPRLRAVLEERVQFANVQEVEIQRLQESISVISKKLGIHPDTIVQEPFDGLPQKGRSFPQENKAGPRSQHFGLVVRAPRSTAASIPPCNSSFHGFVVNGPSVAHNEEFELKSKQEQVRLEELRLKEECHNMENEENKLHYVTSHPSLYELDEEANENFGQSTDSAMQVTDAEMKQMRAEIDRYEQELFVKEDKDIAVPKQKNTTNLSVEINLFANKESMENVEESKSTIETEKSSAIEEHVDQAHEESKEKGQDDQESIQEENDKESERIVEDGNEEEASTTEVKTN
jgi:hypothetical protein